MVSAPMAVCRRGQKRRGPGDNNGGNPIDQDKGAQDDRCACGVEGAHHPGCPLPPVGLTAGHPGRRAITGRVPSPVGGRAGLPSTGRYAALRHRDPPLWAQYASGGRAFCRLNRARSFSIYR